MDIHNIFLETDKLSILELIVRTSILYFVLFISTKAMKFRQPGIITPYNFLMAAGNSHIAASRMVYPKSRPIDAIIIIIIYTLIYLSISYLYFKAPTIVSQKPITLIKNGKIIKKNLVKSKLTIDNIFSILREKNAHNIKDVEYLIAEATGDFSVAINNSNYPPTKLDMAIKTSQEILSEIVIYKGKIDMKVLNKYGLNHEWINNELKAIKIDNVNIVYLGIITPDKNLYVNL